MNTVPKNSTTQWTLMNIVALLKQELLATLEKCPPEIATIRWPTFPKPLSMQPPHSVHRTMIKVNILAPRYIL